MKTGPVRFERRAAAAFLLAAAPLIVAVAAAGGVVALVPFALIVAPMMLLGIAPGFAALDEACGRMARPRRLRPDRAVSRPRSADPAPVSPVLRAPTDRGPPRFAGLVADW